MFFPRRNERGSGIPFTDHPQQLLWWSLSCGTVKPIRFSRQDPSKNLEDINLVGFTNNVQVHPAGIGTKRGPRVSQTTEMRWWH